MNTRKHSGLFGVSFAALLVLGGCSGRDSIVTPEGRSDYLLPSSPDRVMANFVTAYTSMELAGYARILHEDFVFTFQPCDVQKLGLSSNHLDRKEELATASNMFSHAEVKKKDGRVVPGIHGITFEYFLPENEWTAVEGFRGRHDVLARTYGMLVKIEQMTGHVISIQGPSTFYVAGQERAWDSRPGGQFYQLIGWVDLSEGCESE